MPDSTKAQSFQVWTLMALVIVSPLCFELVFPFINQFLLDIGVVDNPADAGFYSGLAESVLAIAQLLTVFPTTHLSDKYGRRPFIIMGTLIRGISIALFGFSSTYWMMLVFRTFGGILGDALTTIRVMGAEMASSKEEEAHLMTLISIFFRVGQVIGLPLGGVLSHPGKRWPSLFGGRFWKQYPYSLPCLVGAAYAFVSMVVGWIVLRETLSTKRPVQERDQVENGETTPLLAEGPTSNEEATRSTSVSGTANESIPATETNPEDKPVSTPQSTQCAPILSVLTRPFLSFLLSTTVFFLMTEIFFAVYPLFAFTPVELGGLHLSEARIGIEMAARSFLLIFMLFFFKPLQTRLGTMAVYRLGVASWLPMILLFPVLNWIAKGNLGGVDGLASYTLLFILLTFWSITGLAWPSSFLLTTEYSPTPESKATVQACLSVSIIIAQSIGPAIGTSLFAFAVNHVNILNGYLFWVVVFTLGLLSSAHSFTIRGLDGARL